MADVARMAGVSPTTVSFVINERPDCGIPDETRARVLAAVRDLGYHPNRQARNLRQRRTRSLGFFVADFMLDPYQHFVVAFFQPLLRAADRRGYQIVAFTGSSQDAVSKFADLVAGHVVDGFIFTDSGVDDPRARYLADAEVPFASFGRTAAQLPQSWVDLDNPAAMATVVDHLVEAGHERIAYLGRPSRRYWWQERVDGVRSRLTHHGLRLRPSWVVAGEDEQVEVGLRRLLQRRDRPTAVITGGDALAVPAYRACRAAGLTVGRDVAVTGFDPLLWMLDPPLTTLAFPIEEAAEALVDRCLRELDSGPLDEPGRYIPVHLVKGRSA
jgi:DNA-binding LacI/PurR family transcriptional regulator